MKCLNCDKSLKIISKDQSKNSKDGATYARNVYECKHCGTWITTETPIKKSVTKKTVKK